MLHSVIKGRRKYHKKTFFIMIKRFIKKEGSLAFCQRKN